ncbi:response regulator transcription factor [Streptomyces alkaliterrae]|uniref:Sensory transduction protein RegX3 n=1 Tax=Streptomyces alkaliterrae TaxID=2213162 RepID=A0A5P0YU36_9ACTN|nr:response regulator transcription factor [Streptomyces alkaliterrae]MBB1255791.1 response regulator transcription factor [Streptomyces alkaliterrae]MBB1261846.1 response regulator transcription factor [Streptomyces alkaliterrae]MQS03824.1 response regulator [Streptomyces alkaliterrae]
MRILLVEDDNRVADALTGSLRRNGYEVVRAGNAADALAAPAVDLVLLDLGLPDRDGIEVCRQLRARGSVPVIAVTARGGEPDRVRGLRSGADDYVVKPFSAAELLARIEAVLRRSMPRRAAEDRLVTVDGLEIDIRRRTVTLDGQPVPLTRKEFDVLAVLVRAEGGAVPRDRIIVEVWHTTYAGMSRTLDVHMANLRGKLGRAGSAVRTVRGVGYRLAATDRAAPDTAPEAPRVSHSEQSTSASPPAAADA